MILSDKQILDSIEHGEIVIEPLNWKSFGTNSYDVHLGPYLGIYKDDVLDPKVHNEI